MIINMWAKDQREEKYVTFNGRSLDIQLTYMKRFIKYSVLRTPHVPFLTEQYIWVIIPCEHIGI